MIHCVRAVLCQQLLTYENVTGSMIKKKRKGTPAPSKTRSAEKTRAAILNAAQSTFAETGYDQTGVRDIAEIAGIDPSLVCRYFGGKQELLAEVLKSQSRLSNVLDGAPDNIGARMAERLLLEKGDEDMLTQMLVVLRAASSHQAAPLLSASIENNFMAPLRAQLKGPNKKERAMLIAAYVLGTAVLRTVLGIGSPTEDKYVAKRLGRAIQGTIES